MFNKKLLTPSLILAASLGVLLLILKTPLAGIVYPNVLVHSFLLLAFTGALFFVCFFSYQKYIKDKEICCYVVSLAFYILGVFTFAHALLVPTFGWGTEALFDISEHYGFFLTSLLLWGLIIPFSKHAQENIYQARTKIFLGTNFLLLIGFVLLFILPPLVEALFGSVNIFIGLTGISFFLLLIFLLTRKEDSFFTASLPNVLALLTVSALAPFFYREWNLVWWYVHFLELASVLLLLLLLLLLRAKKGKGISEVSFSSFSIRTRLFFIIGLTFTAIVANGLIDFRLSQNHVQTQTMDNLVLIADLQEGQVLNWLDTIKQRTADFASDGFIREHTSKIIAGDREAVSALVNHLVKNKMPLDSAVYGVHIMNLEGIVIAANQESEVGMSDMAQEEAYVQAKGAQYGKVAVGDIFEDVHFGEKNTAILTAAPITDKITQKTVGVLMIFFKTQGLSDVLTGKAQTELGALSTWTARKKTLEIILVNQERMIITESRFVVNAILKKKADTEPVRKCGHSEEISGEWLDYRGVSVFGASMCFSNGWTLVAKIDKDEALGTLGDYLQQNLLSGSAVFFVILIAMYLFTIGIIAPLNELSVAAKKIGTGDFTARVKLMTRDEFGQLSRVFNQMAENIQKGNAGLEQRAKEEETSRLAMTNILGDLGVEKKRAERFAQDLEKFKLAIENTSEQIIITDKDGIVLYGNPVIEKLTGFTVKEAVGMKAGKLWGGHMGKAFYEQMWKTILTDKKTFTGELTNKRKNGEEYTAAIIISPILNELGDVQFFVAVERDVTKEREIDKAKTEFVSLASHQLRTPLSSINWYTEMLLAGDAGKINEEQKKYLDEIYRGNQRMVALVNALLNVSRLELGTFMVEPEPTDVVKLAQSVIDEQKSQIEVKKITLSEKYVDNLPILSTDPKLLRIVFQNLLSNAVKYTPEGGSITLSLLSAKGQLSIVITDTGYGIPKGQQDKIFSKLFRADNVREKDTEGTGLGLYIVKSIIDHSGGKIWFESKENNGTTFHITLPIVGMKKKEGTKVLT